MQSRCFTNNFKITVAVTVSLMLAFMPFTVNLQNYRITLERNEANAIAPVFAGAAGFLEAAAAAAGLSTSEFVATIAGATAVSVGMGIGTEQGISMGGSLSNNLEALVDAADYPAWDTLSSSDQESWGSRDNYDSAKMNSLLAGYGLGDAYTRYQNSWGTSDDFGFTSSESNKLEQIGQVGTNWIDGIGNQVQDIRTLISNAGNITQWAAGNVYDYTKSDNDVNWPASMPNTASYESTSQIQIGHTGNSTNFVNIMTDKAVYAIATYNNVYQSGKYYYLPVKWILFSTSTFTYKNISASNWNNCDTFSKDGNTLYYASGSISMTVAQNAQVTSNITVNGPVDINNDGMRWVAYYSLFGAGNSNQDYQKIVDYPQAEINSGQYNDIDIYYPIDGITPDTTWDDLITEPDNPTEPDLSGIIALLRHIDNDIHNLNIPGEPDLQPLITVVQHIDTDLHKFQFSDLGELKVKDNTARTTLDNIYTRLGQILSVLNSQNDAVNAPDLIGDFDFDEFENKVPDLLETISELAPFGSILLLSSMYSILANYTKIENPELVFPFDFGGFDNQNHELIIDLSWLDDIKPLINFLCIAMLVIAIANATIRIVEIEAAS